MKIYDIARPLLTIQTTGNGWESGPVVLAHSAKQLPQFTEDDIKLNVFDNWKEFNRDTNPALHALMRRRHQHALFGPSGLTGLWQPEDLYSNCKSKRFLRQQQALWEIGEGRTSKPGMAT